MSKYTKLYRKRNTVEELADPGDFIVTAGNDFTTFKLYNNYTELDRDISQKKYPCVAEHIPPKTPVKFYADIETNNADSERSSYNFYIEKLRAFFINKNLDIIVLKAHRGTKLSNHIIVPRLVFSDLISLKEYIKENNLLDDKFMDTSVYNANRCFKCVNSIKPGEGEESRMVFDRNLSTLISIKDTFIRNVDPAVIPITIESNENNRKSICQAATEIYDIPNEITSFVKNNYKRKIEATEILNDGTNTTLKCLLTIGVCPIAEKIHAHTFGHRQSVYINKNRAFLLCEDKDECGSEKYNVITDKRKLSKKIIDYISSLVSVPNGNLSEEATRYLKDNYISYTEPDPDTVEFEQIKNRQIVGTGEVYKHIFTYEDGYMPMARNSESKLLVKALPIDHGVQSIIENKGYMIINNYFNTNSKCSKNDVLEIEKIELPNELFGDEELTRIITVILQEKNETYMTMLVDNYVYSNNKWYVYEGNIWSESPSVDIKKSITEKTIEYLEIVKNSDLVDTNIKKIAYNTIRDIEKGKNINQLLSISEVKKYNKYFYEKLNKKTGYLVYPNKVYDFNQKKYIEHSRELYNTYCMPFDKDSSVNNPEVYKYFETVFPIKEERDYFLWSIAMCRNDSNPNDNIYFLHGNTANSKSTIVNFISNYFGNYAYSIRQSVLVGKDEIDPNTATNWLVTMTGRRFLFTSEINKDTNKINSARLKQLTGGEKIPCRSNYGSETNIEITGSIFISCNDIPEFRGGIDDAISRRIKIITFRSHFEKDPSKVNPDLYIFPADDKIKTKITRIDWLQTLDNILDKYQDIDRMEQPLSVRENLELEKYKSIDDSLNRIHDMLAKLVCYKKDSILNRTLLWKEIITKNGLESMYKQKDFYTTIVPSWLKLNFSDKNIKYDCGRYTKSHIFGWKDFELVTKPEKSG